MTAAPHPLHHEVVRFAEDAALLLERAAAAPAAPAGTPAIQGATATAPGTAPATSTSTSSSAPTPEAATASSAGAAAAIRAEVAAARDGAATVVVVGEKKRGKSSLVNALVEHRDLLPVEVDVATGVHILVRHAEKPHALAYVDGGQLTRPIELGDLTEYAAVDPVTQAPYRGDVHHVEVGIPAQLLSTGLRLIDTPGVGGLVSGHARITMATLHHADALVFVVNGSSELTASELAFLEEATARIAEVVFVLTQTDKYRSWPQVLERNRELLARHAPRYAAAPWYPVSSRAHQDALTALARGDEERAARHMAADGFVPLRSALTHRVALRAAELRLANIVHVGRAGLAPLAAAEERRLRALAQDPTLVEDIQRQRDALRALQDSDARWRGMLRTATRELERRLRTGFRRNVNDLRQLADAKIASLSGDELAAALPRDLEAGIEAVWMDLDHATREGVARLTALMERECGIGDEESFDGLSRPDRLAALPPLVSSVHDAAGVLGAVERIVPTLSTGVLTVGVTAMVASGVLLPLAAGFGMVTLLSRRRRKRDELVRARGDGSRYAQRVISELETEVPPEITQAVDTVGERLAERLGDRITAQRRLLEDELANLQRHARASKEQRAAERDRAQRRMAALTGLLRRADDLTDRLATTPGPAGPHVPEDRS
ncbi:dynamin family protein [Streptomyces phaeofaciens JCM 4814]|uniref:Dynamin n=1 Tax=Streptomyces phaeofaciens TaxID=68254 RepID=A0A918HMV8_9ACTN|nr:dynamin family protein [Streptomyces phaeofaciens]GGT78170.1 dynamin [Streptomyces phaeofaciens]